MHPVEIDMLFMVWLSASDYKKHTYEWTLPELVVKLEKLEPSPVVEPTGDDLVHKPGDMDESNGKVYIWTTTMSTSTWMKTNLDYRLITYSKDSRIIKEILYFENLEESFKYVKHLISKVPELERLAGLIQFENMSICRSIADGLEPTEEDGK